MYEAAKDVVLVRLESVDLHMVSIDSNSVPFHVCVLTLASDTSEML